MHEALPLGTTHLPVLTRVISGRWGCAEDLARRIIEKEHLESLGCPALGWCPERCPETADWGHFGCFWVPERECKRLRLCYLPSAWTIRNRQVSGSTPLVGSRNLAIIHLHSQIAHHVRNIRGCFAVARAAARMKTGKVSFQPAKGLVDEDCSSWIRIRRIGGGRMFR